MTDGEMDSLCQILRIACCEAGEEFEEGVRVICGLIRDHNPVIVLGRELGTPQLTISGLFRKETFYLHIDDTCVVSWEVLLTGKWDENKNWTVEETTYRDFDFAKIIIKELKIDYRITEMKEPAKLHKYISSQSKDGKFGLFTIGAAGREPLARYDDVSVALSACHEMGEEAHFVCELVQDWVKVAR